MVIHRRIEYTTIRVPCGSKRVLCPMEKGLVTIMNQKPALVILAAGMGSRFGGLKQLTPVGPGGEMIIDYSIHDAIRAGFGKIVFVIKHEIEEEFKEKIGRRTEAKIPVSYVYQELDRLPEGYTVPEGRVKPWGTRPRRPLLPGRGGWALHGDQRGRFLRPELLPSARGIFGPAPVGFRKAPYRYGGLHPGKHPDRERQRLPGDLLCG